jgi:hypothetical protein
MSLVEIHNFINDLWAYLKKYAHTPDTDPDFWHNVIHDADVIWKKYGQDDMVGKMIVDAAAWIEATHRNEVVA